MEFTPYRPWSIERRGAARERVRAGPYWIGERPAIAERMWAEGSTFQQIADKLGGISRSGVSGYIHRQGFKRDPELMSLWREPSLVEIDSRSGPGWRIIDHVDDLPRGKKIVVSGDMPFDLIVVNHGVDEWYPWESKKRLYRWDLFDWWCPVDEHKDAKAVIARCNGTFLSE